MIKKWLVSFYLGLFIILPSVVFAQSNNDEFDPTAAGAVSAFMMKTQQEFNRELISTMTKDLMENPVVGWKTGGLVKIIFTICFVIALAQALSKKDPRDMVTEMTKLAFWSWLVIALLGGPTYKKFNFLNTGDSRYTSRVQSLDADIFNFAAYHLDQAANSLFSAAGPQKLMQSSIKNKILTENLMNARRYCQTGPAGAPCMQLFMKDDLVNPDSVKNGIKTDDSKSSGSFALPDIIVKLFEKIYLLFSDLTLLAFYFFSWLIDLIRAAMNMFILLSFGIITGTSFFLMKFIFPFAVLPAYRGKVMQAMKVPLSATLYGFTTSLIVYISAVGYSSMNTAAIKVIFGNIATGNLGSLAVAVPIIQTSVFTGMLIFALLQVFAIAKIPQLSRNLLDLSFDSFVNFAKEVVSTTIGVVGTVSAAVATGGASIAMGGAGGMIGKATGSVSGGLSAVGQKLGFSAGSGAPSSLFRGGGGFGGGGGFEGLGGIKPSPSIGGMQVGAAQDSAATPSPSTTSVAQAVSQESVFSGKEVKSPDKKSIETTADGGGAIGKKQAKDFLNSLKQAKPGLASVINSGLEAGIERSGSFEKLVGNKMQSSEEAVTGGIYNLSERISDPKGYREKQKEIREAKIALGEDPGKEGILESENWLLSKDSTVMRGLKNIGSGATGAVTNNQVWKSFQNNREESSRKSHETVSSAISNVQEAFANTSLKPGSQRTQTIEQAVSSVKKQTMDNQQKSEIQNFINNNNIKSGRNINPEMVNQMVAYKSKFNMDKESTRSIDNALDKQTKESLVRIEEGKGIESDYELAYKSKNFDYTSNKTRKKVQQLLQENEEFGTYAREQDESNDMRERQFKDQKISSRKGTQLVRQMSERVDSGLYSRDSFRKTVGEKAVEFNKEMSVKSKSIAERDISKSLKAKELQEKLFSKLKSAKDEDIKFKYNNKTYEFAEGKDGISDDVFAVDGQTSDDFSGIDEEFISKLKEESIDLESRINESSSGSPQYIQASKKRVEKMQRNLRRIKQILAAFEEDKNNKK